MLATGPAAISVGCRTVFDCCHGVSYAVGELRGITDASCKMKTAGCLAQALRKHGLRVMTVLRDFVIFSSMATPSCDHPGKHGIVSPVQLDQWLPSSLIMHAKISRVHYFFSSHACIFLLLGPMKATGSPPPPELELNDRSDRWRHDSLALLLL